jgi:hypothetical protein
MSATLDRWEAEARHDLEVFNQSGWGCDAKPLAEHVLALIAVARAAAEVYRPYSKARDGASVQGTRHKALRAALATLDAGGQP